MIRARTFNFGSPLGLTLIAVAAAVMVWLALIVVGGLGFRFDPLNSTARRADRAEAAAARATSDARARRIEVAGAADTARRVDDARRTSEAARHIVNRFIYSAQVAPDANALLDPDRTARLHALDRSLCEARPAVCSTAPAGYAGGGGGTLSTGRLAPSTHLR